MANITKTFFKWQDIEAKSDMDRLRLCLENLPDARLMQLLELHRRNGRNDYPIRPMWNALIAGIVFQHDSSNRSVVSCRETESSDMSVDSIFFAEMRRFHPLMHFHDL